MALGALESATGNATDCMHVDGSSGPCGDATPSFVDADALTGIVDGSNTSFSLSNAPNPAASLAVYRNGMLDKAGVDYTVNGGSIQFLAASTPQPGDTLLASYRLTAEGSGGRGASVSESSGAVRRHGRGHRAPRRLPASEAAPSPGACWRRATGWRFSSTWSTRAAAAVTPSQSSGEEPPSCSAPRRLATRW